MNKALSREQLIRFSLLSSLSTGAWSDLQPLEDAELGRYVGQAYIEMDSYIDNSTKFSRITFGENIKIQANADLIELGQYSRSGETQAADLSLSNVGFGYIDDDGKIIPFEVNNPFFEWAIDDVTNDVLGFRMGFEEASGVFQADIASFSGNIGMTFNDAANSITYAGQLSGASQTLDNIRSSVLGLNSSDCSAVSGVECSYDLSNFRSFNVGDADGSSTSDFFVSFQKQNLTWKWGDQANGETSSYTTTSGFFMSLPTSNVINLGDASTGTSSLRTEFIDRGVGRWTN